MDTELNIEEIKESLCYYDKRNSNNQLYYREEYSDFDKKDNGDCYCDNCFYGRTRLANIILKLLEDVK